MPTNVNKVEDPCQECRDRHLKCDDGRPKCKQCTRLGEDCHRSRAKPKFRFGSSAKYDQTFAKDQVWLTQSKNAKLQFVDQGPELENYYSTEEVGSIDQAASTQGRQRTQSNESTETSPVVDVSNQSPALRSVPGSDFAVISPRLYSNDVTSTPLHIPKRRKTDEAETVVPGSTRQRSPQPPQDPKGFYVVPESPKAFGYPSNIDSPEFSEPVKRKVYAEYQRIEDSNAAYIPASDLLSPAIWKKHFVWPNHLTTIQCTCLMRYYIDHLGPALDIADPLRTFTLLVPQRARRCPPLLNAIFTIAARHLSSIPKHRTKGGIIQYGRNKMPRLDDGQAIKYQNASIAYLKELCNHPEHVQDEDLLAATVILRYYEEFDTSLGGDRAETVVRPFQLFVTAQAYPLFLSQYQFGSLDFNITGSYAAIRPELEAHLKSYQHASFRIALRQECARSFMKQQPIGLDLEAWSILEGFDEAEDFVWADRHLYHLARVLQFCFENDARGQQHVKRWQELQNFELLWEDNKPFSFAAIHYKEADKADGEVFPEIWYLAEVHAIAVQCLDLSRILLAVYNPSLPRLGPGAALAQKKTSAKIREAVVQLCGVAVSLPGCENALIQACMAIALCGEHFSERLEQNALLNLLSRLQEEHGLNTSDTMESLKQSWSW